MLLKEQFAKTADFIERLAARRQRKLVLPLPETVIQSCREPRDLELETKTGDYALGAVQKLVSVQALPQATFKPTDLRLTGLSLNENGRGGRDLSNYLVISDIRCGTVSQYSAIGDVPLKGMGKRFFDTLCPGFTFTVTVRNYGAEPVLLRGAAFGLTDRNSIDNLLIAKALRALAKMVPDTLEVTSPQIESAHDMRSALIAAMAKVNESMEVKSSSNAKDDGLLVVVEEMGKSTGMAMAMMKARRTAEGVHMLSLKKVGVTELTNKVREVFERGFFEGYDVAARIREMMPKEMRESFTSYALASAMLPQPPTDIDIRSIQSTEQTIIAELLGLKEAPKLKRRSNFEEESNKRTITVPTEPLHIEPRGRVEKYVLPQCRFTVHKVDIAASTPDRSQIRYTDGIVVRDILVGGVSQFVARPGGVQMSAFEDMDVLFDTCEPGQTIGIVIENTRDEPVTVEVNFTGGPHDMETTETLSSPSVFY